MRKTIIFLIFVLSSTVALAATNLPETEQQGLLKFVVGYLNDIVDKDTQIVIHDPEDNSERTFQLKGLWDVINENNKEGAVIYSIQIDSDEIGMKKPNAGVHRWLNFTILYADVKKTQNSWEVIQLRVGPRHLRQTSEGHDFEESYYYKWKKL